MNAIELLKDDHRKVKGLFEEFEQTDDSERKGELAKEIVTELKVHTALEEESFYPAVREQAQESELILEAEEEHHVVDLLIREIQKMDPEDEKFQAKMKVLAESVKHHIEEEESAMMPKAEQADIDLEEMGEQIAQRKEELLTRESNGQHRRANGKTSRRPGGKTQARSRAHARARR